MTIVTIIDTKDIHRPAQPKSAAERSRTPFVWQISISRALPDGLCSKAHAWAVFKCLLRTDVAILAQNAKQVHLPEGSRRCSTWSVFFPENLSFSSTNTKE